MEIFIFSAGRADGRQETYHALKDHCALTMVVQAEQAVAYLAAGYKNLLTLPEELPQTLPAARQYVVSRQRQRKRDPIILMLDDDLSFSARRADDTSKFRPMVAHDYSAMLDVVARGLNKFAHVGICSREGGNRMLQDTQATRMSRVLGYNLELVPKDVLFNRVLLPEDFDVTLQLLYKGLPNLVLSQWCHNQPGSNTAGGCSTYRTIEVHNEWMQKFGALHPDVVKIVEKQTKTSWGGQPRLDAVVQWKKALAMGQAK